MKTITETRATTAVKITKYKLGFAVFILGTIGYLLFSLFTQLPSTVLAHYKITNAEYHWLTLAVVVPLVAIWFTAYYAYTLLDQYSHGIKTSKEGPAFKYLSYGIGSLAFGLLITSLVSSILGIIEESHPITHQAALITNNYLGLLVAFVTLHFFSLAAHRLSFQVRKNSPLALIRIFMFLFLAFSVTYGYLVTQNFTKHNLLGYNLYGLPRWVVLLTYVTPYLYVWFIGFWSAMEMWQQALTSKGIVYKEAFKYLASGFMLIIVTSISLQFIYSITQKLKTLGISALLLITLGILVLYAVGVILLTVGSKKLKLIEEV